MKVCLCAMMWGLLALLVCVSAQSPPAPSTVPEATTDMDNTTTAAPTPEPLSCDEFLSPPLNGAISYSSVPPFPVGTMATYSCNEGYVPVTEEGTIERECMDIGDGVASWDGAPITCEQEVFCDALTFPANGAISYSSVQPFPVGTTATYSCNEGYVPVTEGGTIERVCMDVGDGIASWDGGFITCEQEVTESCMDSLTPPENGSIQYTDDPPYSLGTTATYLCNEGYTVITGDGDGLAVCVDGDGVGVWNDSPVTCQSTVVETPTVSLGLSPAVAMTGESEVLTCTITFNGSPTSPYNITWKDSSESDLLDVENIVISEVNTTSSGAVGTLTIENVLASQAGAYTCTARVESSEFGVTETQAMATLMVQIAPLSVSVFPSPVSPYIGHSVKINCGIAADVHIDISISPTVEWQVSYLEDGVVVNEPVPMNPELIQVTEAVFTSSLEFQPLLRDRNYTCMASADPLTDSGVILGSEVATDTLDLSVEGPPLTVSIAPLSSVIASQAPYNNETLICCVALPNDVIGLEILNFQWSYSQITGPRQIYATEQSDLRTGDFEYTSTLMVTAVSGNTTGSGVWTCGFEVFANALEMVVDSDSVSARVSVKGPASPAGISQHAILSAATLAVVEWTVPQITFTPELYTVQYLYISDDDLSFLESVMVESTRNISAVNQRYQVVIEGLMPDSLYRYRIVSTNQNGSIATNLNNFHTSFLASAVLLPDHDPPDLLSIPLGAQVQLNFSFTGPSSTSLLQFIPLFHSPLQEPVLDPASTSVQYSQASPSLSGDYILCRSINFESRRKRNFIGPTTECTEKVTLQVYTPSLSLSTSLLVATADELQNPTISCTPSDPLAPVRWRSMFGTYDDPVISTTYQVQADDELGHTVSLPLAVYEGELPDRTEVLYCDLINIEQDSFEETDPQMVTVRFLRNPVAILHNDRELDSSAVINSFLTFFRTTDPALSLRCLSSLEENLVWEASEVAALDPGPLTSEYTATLPFVTVSYLQGVNVNNRDVSLLVNPVDSQTIGYYSCRSSDSNDPFTASVLATTVQPFWEVTSPSFIELPIGVAVRFSALYAYFSDGVTNTGPGLSVSVRFLGEGSLGEAGGEVMSLVDTSTEREGNVFEYSFIASDVNQSGLYEIEASEGDSFEMSKMIELTVIFPFFVDPELSVFVRSGDLVTLTCLPNDTRTPVQWAQAGFEELINSRADLFTLAPPLLNHTLSFNASLVAQDLFEYQPDQLFTMEYTCGLFRLLDSETIDLTIQPEVIRLQHSDDGPRILSNTVVNMFQTSSDYNYPDYDYGDRKRNADYGPYDGGQERLEVRCSAAQGSHSPLWYTDNGLLGEDGGVVTCDHPDNNQIVDSNYVARLRLYNLEASVEGVYTCRSQISNEEESFQLEFANPFVAPSSTITKEFVEGQPLEIQFRIAVNSDGNTWDTSRTSFSFASLADGDRERIGQDMPPLFLTSDSSSPQDYVYSSLQARRSDEGFYTAMVAEDTSCETTGCGSAVGVIRVDIRRVCPEEVVWPVTLSNTVASIPCTEAGSSFQSGTFISRPCFPDGSWGEVDFTSCTLASDNTTLLIVSFNLLTPKSDSDLPFAPFGAVPANTMQFDNKDLVNAMQDVLNMTGVQYTTVSVSQLIPINEGTLVVFEIVLDSNFGLGSLGLFEDYVSNGLGLVGFGQYTVDDNYPIVVTGITPTASCQCGPNGGSDPGSGESLITVIELCTGLSLSPCNCSVSGDCLCQAPYIGDGGRCTLDSDSDSYPDEALVSPSCDQTLTSPSYCTQDNCPSVYNVDQDPAACQDIQELTGCPYGIDIEWNIEWPNTALGSMVSQPCPGELDAVSGQASRYCSSTGEWELVDVLDCQAMEFVELAVQATSVFSGEAVMVEDTVELVEQLAVITEPDRTDTSLLPSSLNTTNQVLSSVLDLLEDSGNENTTVVNEFVFEVLDNILDLNNTRGWMDLQQTSAGSQVMLDNTERLGELLARSQSNNSQETVRMSRNNIAISATQYNSSGSIRAEDLRFPLEADLVNYNTSSAPASIEIPAELVEERLGSGNGTFVPVVFLLIQNLEAFLPSSYRQLDNSSAASSIISSQVGSRDTSGQSQALQEQPVLLNFSFSTVSNAQQYECVFWNFSEPVGNGSWVSEGVVTMTSVTNCGERVTTVQCNSSHLTSFAVLVDVSGALRDICDAERIALQIVSYIGCIVSVISLVITVAFFISMGKILLTQSVHYFVHLNLALSLLLAYLIFIVGVETAVGNSAGCAFVAALLHYFFLSSFCWMLCEGVMLFLLLVVVFSKVAKWWWFFLLLGYATPLPFVVVTLAVRSDFYGVRDETGNLQFCWLSTEEGTIFGFVAPMIAIVLINVVFLLLSLRALWKNRIRSVRRSHRKDSDNKKTIRVAKSVFLASIVLLPLLGITWVFGLLTVSQNTTVFAWIFTILNSLQGFAMLFFHVLRSDRVWGKLKPKFVTSLKNMTQRSSYDPSKASAYSATGSSKFKSTADSELSMGTMKSVREPEKKDLGLSVSEYTETKVDLALEEGTGARDEVKISVKDKNGQPEQPVADNLRIIGGADDVVVEIDIAADESGAEVKSENLEGKKEQNGEASFEAQEESDALVIENTVSTQSLTPTQADGNRKDNLGTTQDDGNMKENLGTTQDDTNVKDNLGTTQDDTNVKDNLGAEQSNNTDTQTDNEIESEVIANLDTESRSQVENEEQSHL